MPAYIQNTEKTGHGHCHRRPCPPPEPVESKLPHSTNISLDQLARQGSNPAATNTAIYIAIAEIKAAMPTEITETEIDAIIV